MMDLTIKSTIERIASTHGAHPGAVIAALQDLQDQFHYIPQEAFPALARTLGMEEAAIYSVATFYENFSLKPKGKYVLRVCDGTACHVRKSVPILTRLYDELGVNEEQPTTADGLFTVETVSCLGACGLAPVMTVNDEVHASMTPDKAAALIAALREVN